MQESPLLYHEHAWFLIMELCKKQHNPATLTGCLQKNTPRGICRSWLKGKKEKIRKKKRQHCGLDAITCVEAGDATTANRISLLPMQRPSAWKALQKRNNEPALCHYGWMREHARCCELAEGSQPCLTRNFIWKHWSYFIKGSIRRTDVTETIPRCSTAAWWQSRRGTLIAFPSGNKTPRCCLPVEITRRRPAGGQQLSQAVKTYFLQARDDRASLRSGVSVLQRLVSSETSPVLTIPRGLHLRWQELFLSLKMRQNSLYQCFLTIIWVPITRRSSPWKWEKSSAWSTFRLIYQR